MDKEEIIKYHLRQAANGGRRRTKRQPSYQEYDRVGGEEGNERSSKRSGLWRVSHNQCMTCSISRQPFSGCLTYGEEHTGMPEVQG